MIGGKDIYSVVGAMVPLYWVMFLGYASVRWWKVLTAEQCLGINRFVSVFAVPFLTFHFIITSNPYHMDIMFILADILSKVAMISLLAMWACINATVKAVGSGSSCNSVDWVVTIFSLATLPNLVIVGVPLLDAMYGVLYRGLMVQLGVLQGIIWCPFIIFLYEYRAICLQLSSIGSTIITKAEAKSSENGESASNNDVISIDSNSNIDSHINMDELNREVHVLSRSQNLPSNPRTSTGSGPHLANISIATELNSSSVASMKSESSSSNISMFQTNGDHFSDVSKGFSMHSCTNQQDHAKILNEDMLKETLPSTMLQDREDSIYHNGSDFPGSSVEKTQKNMLKALGTNVELKGHPPATVTLRPILQIVVWKLIQNPITYSSLLGLVWALIGFRWNIALPKIVDNSVTIVSSAGLGMAMFSLGLFMALQPRLISCGRRNAALALGMKLIISPIVVAAMASVIGLRGVDLRAEIIQAALPQGIITFILAREYDLHPDILSTGVFFSSIISLPITLLYYVLLELA